MYSEWCPNNGEPLFRLGLHSIFWCFGLALLISPLTLVAQPRESARVSGLIELYGTSGTVVYGDEDEFSANLLLESLKPQIRGIKMVPAREAKRPKDDLVIYVGSLDSNPLAAKAFKSLGYRVNWEKLTDGSFILKSVRKSGKTTVFVTGKDRLGTLYATYDLRNYYLREDMGRVLMNELNLVDRAQLKYRWFWNWDGRTHWNLARVDDRRPSDPDVAAPSTGAVDSYLREMKTLIDFMSEHKLNGLVLWGFLRASRGGVSSARELCTYAEQRGVRIIPGVGLTGNGGIFYEGEHPYNLDSWIASHPELRSVDQKGNYRDHTICPEKPDNRKWLAEGIRWLYQSARIGGISLEVGDSFVCYCDDCRSARQLMDSRDSDAFKDLARAVGFAVTEALKVDPKSWVTYRTHAGFDFESIQKAGGSSHDLQRPFPPDFIKVIDDSAIAQWDLEGMLSSNSWPSPFKSPSRHSVGLMDWASVPSNLGNQIFWKRIEEVTHHAYSSNLEGLVLPGELAPSAPNVELNYLTFSELVFNPAADLEEVFRFKISRLYGGEESARKLMTILNLLEDETGMLKANVDEALNLARKGLEQSDPNGKEAWSKFIRYLETLKQSPKRNS